MVDEPELRTAPLPTVRRLPTYLNILRRYQAEGLEVISGTRISEELGLDSIQVRKDFALTGMVGKPRVGFEVATAIRTIEAFLGWDNTTDAFLVGAGSLGTALLGYDGFRRYGLNIVAAFDSDPSKVGREVHGKPILPTDQLVDLAGRMHVAMGVLTVPAASAQAVADLMVGAGIRAVWNFAPVALKVPAGVIVQNTELPSELATLSVLVKEARQRASTAGP